MGLFADQDKKLIIVHDERTEEFANFLKILMSMGHKRTEDEKNEEEEKEETGRQKVGLIPVAIWSEKQYADQKLSLSNDDYLLFIGYGDTINKETKYLDVVLNKYGMLYGWLGRRGFLRTVTSPMGEKELNEFLKFAVRYDSKLSREDLLCFVAEEYETKSRSDMLKESFSIAVGTLSPVIGLPFMIKEMKGVVNETAKLVKGENLFQKIEKRSDYRYKILTKMFYEEGLNKFLND